MALAALLLIGSGCTRRTPLPPAVAYIGQQPIRAPELKAELDRVRRALVPRRDPSEPSVAPGEQALQVLRRTVLDDLIDRRLLLQQAKKAGITVSAEEVRNALAARQPPSADGGVAPGVPENSPLWARTRDQLVIDRFLVREVAARVAVSPQEEQAYYDAHQDRFSRPEEVRCSEILVPRREDAQALKVQLARGADFAKLAREQSVAVDRAEGGDLGWFGRGEMPPPLENGCFGLKKGQTSGIVQSPYGYHLFKLVDRRAAQKLSFPEVEEQINLLLTRRKVARAERDYIEKLRTEQDVSLVEAEIDKVR